MLIPKDTKEFLYWVKETTEKRWAVGPQSEEEECGWDRHESFWGAHWIDGLSPHEIDNLEKKWNVIFPHDYRLFLEVLHTIDRPEVIEYEDFDSKIMTEERPFFYNWRTNESEIQDRFDWPFRTILEDVEGTNKVWLKSWGKRPDDKKMCRQVLKKWITKDPNLIPVYGHQFLISDQYQTGIPYYLFGVLI